MVRALLALLLLCIWHACAVAGTWVRTDIADVRLVSAVAATGSERAVPLGLQFRLEEDWKIYWRTPGDAGYPPELDTSDSHNLERLEWSWPVPERFDWNGLESIGYGDEVVLPLLAVLLEPGAPLEIAATLDALVCSEICIPLTAQLHLTVPAGPGGPTAYTQLIDRYRARVPTSGDGLGLSVEGVTRSDGAVRVSLRSDVPLQDPVLFVESDRAGYGFRAPRVEVAGDGLAASVRLEATVPAGGSLRALPVVITAVDGARFVETAATVTDPPAAGTPLLVMIGLALIGGLILNLMPCVLPVLSLKLMQVLRAGHDTRSTVRVGFLATAAGVVASFLALAAGAIALRHAGVAIGWGIQFQQPLFLIALSLVLVVFAGSMIGSLEIRLPGVLARLAGVDGGGHWGNFLSGAFATLLATPCSAPFVGTALGFALSAGTPEILAIFTAMGIGLAAPWLGIAAFPALVTLLPRPGRWMAVVRAVLALALAVTAAWLVAIAAEQVDGTWRHVIVLAVAVMAAALAARAWWWRRGLGMATAVLACVALLAAGAAPPGGRPGPDARAVDGSWEEFDPGRITGLVADGRVVFVDVTADWCLTCKVNDAVVFATDPVAGQFSTPDVVPMRADWTRPDDAIARYLSGFGRYGIPFNAVYGPGAPDGVPLPELLSPGAVLDALAEARGSS